MLLSFTVPKFRYWMALVQACLPPHILHPYRVGCNVEMGIKLQVQIWLMQATRHIHYGWRLAKLGRRKLIHRHLLRVCRHSLWGQMAGYGSRMQQDCFPSHFAIFIMQVCGAEGTDTFWQSYGSCARWEWTVICMTWWSRRLLPQWWVIHGESKALTCCVHLWDMLVKTFVS